MEKFNNFLVFLIPIFLGLPDVAINTGAINLRIDDLLVYLFFFTAFTDIIRIKKNIFHKIQYYLFFYAFLSFLIIMVANPMLSSNYEAFRAFGSFPFLLAFPYILQQPVFRKFIFRGAIFGGIIYLISLGNNYNTILMQGEILKTSGVFKREISFDTLNPNAVASIGLIIGWLNILSFIENKNKINAIIGALLLTIPFFIFARGNSIGVLTAIAMIIIFQKKSLKSYFNYLILALFGLYLFYFIIDQSLLQTATNVDVKTGQGFSGRFELWANGIDLALKRPILGSGFTTEMQLFKKYYNGHMSHQVLLRYSIELGLINLAVFLSFVFLLLINRLIKFRKSLNMVYLIQFAILLCFFIADMSAQLLYFNKYAYIIYALTLYNVTEKSNTYNIT